MEQVLLQGGLTSRSSSLTAEHGVKQAREKLVEVDTKLRALTGKK